VPAIKRALSVLETLASSSNGLTLAAIARRLQLPKTSAHAVLLTLERHGYVLRNEQTKRFLFGTALFNVANSALNRLDLRELARPLLTKLMQETRMTVHLAVLGRDQAILVDKVEPPGLLRLATWIGKTMDLHCSGVGKVLLAYLPDDELVRITREHGFPRYNENTITSVRRLREEAAGIRRSGFALEDEEGELGFRCIAAPVFDYRGAAIATISIAGTTRQITPDRVRALADLVKPAASSISKLLGFVPTSTNSH
jgi:DNA-binding IclR family transcriptional regulator